MQYHRTVLSNGLRLITIPMPVFESVTTLVMVGAGSRYETKKNNGISHFLEHMAFKGTQKRPSALAISSLIDGIGGEFNAFTDKEITGYYIKSSKNNIKLSLDVLSDMLMHAKLDTKEIDKERGVILEEINLYEDTPVRKIGDIYESLLYGDTPMGWDTAGEKEIIKKITREDFVQYMDDFYSGANCTVVVAGGVDPKKTFDLVSEYFSAMKRFKTKKHKPLVQSQKKPEMLVKHKQTEQVHLAFGVRTASVDCADRYPLSVLSAILGGGMSSRLFHEVREKRGLAYYVRTQSEHYSDCGTLLTTAGVDPKRINDAVEVILAEYSKAGAGSLAVTDDELKKAKQFIKGHLVLELEDSRAVAGYYAHQELLEKKILNPDEVIAKINVITKNDIDRVGKKYFVNKRLNLAIIGNFTDGQELQKLLEL